MLPDRDIELAHAEAFDFAFGNLPSARRAEFNRHLAGCGYCQAVVDEYSEIGQVMKHLPPHVSRQRSSKTGPSPRWSPRSPSRGPPGTALTPRTRTPPGPTRFPGASLRRNPRPGSSRFPSSSRQRRTKRHCANRPPAGTGRPQAPPAVTRLPVWRRSRGRLAAIVAVAAAIITAAIVIPLSLPGSGGATVIPLYATAAAKVSGVGAPPGRQRPARMPPAAGISP